MILNIKAELANQGKEQIVDDSPPPYETPASYSVYRAETGRTPNGLPEGRPVPPTPASHPQNAQLPPTTNFSKVDKWNTNLHDRFVIDPGMQMPEFVSASAEGRNLSLKCWNGSIDAEVWLVGDGKKKAIIDVTGWNGPITLRLHGESKQTFDLNINEFNGKVTLGIPTSYRGKLNVKTANGWVGFSTSLAPHTTTFSDVRGTRSCFVGEFTNADFDEGEWQGSSINIDTKNSRVKVCYENEMPDKVEARADSFFKKLFSPAQK